MRVSPFLKSGLCMFIYHHLFTLVLKSPDGVWPITYIIIIIIIIIIDDYRFQKVLVVITVNFQL